MDSMTGWRTRWAAVGAACAVAIGAGGFGIVNASTSSGDRAIYVPVTPTRVLDTRLSSKVVNRTIRLVVEGIITTSDGVSQQVVPTDASAVAINITATSTRKNGDYGYVTAFPCISDADVVPNASSLNFENGVDIANALNVTTSANGSICLYVYGTADLLVDVAGFYTDHNHDDRYYTKTEVDDALKCAVQGLSCSVGDMGPGGGIVFYVDLTAPAGSNYLEVACAGWSDGTCGGTDLNDPTAAWGCVSQEINGANGTVIGTGEQNTIDIVNDCATAGIAASLASNLILNSQTDWFLPSKDELNALCAWAYNYPICYGNNSDGATLTYGGFLTDIYWSSSESSGAYAWHQNFYGGQAIHTKSDRGYHIRPVRAF
jgi:hypothetical protein